MERTYNWKNEKQVDVELDLTIAPSALLDHMEWKASCRLFGARFSAAQSGEIASPLRLSGIYNGKRTPLTLTIPEDVLATIRADMVTAEADLDNQIMHGVHTYRVNDTDGYGTRNGFGDSVRRLIAIIIAERDRHSIIDTVEKKDVTEQIMTDLRRIFDSAAKATYTPDPVQDDWSDDFKAAYAASVANRTAPGTAEIQAEDIATEIDRLFLAYLREHLPARIAAIEEKLSRVSGLTDAQARASERAYNDAINEGGEGYVPHRIGMEEADKLREKLDALKKTLTIIAG